MSTLKMLEYSDFNPRSREGSDRFSVPSGRICMVISIHAPARGATDIFCIIRFGFIHFNPRSREGSDHLSFLDVDTLNNFNPRSREGSDVMFSAPIISFFIISIHAPARGATKKTHHTYYLLLISIHAPARGATTSLTLLIYAPIYFNPRSREGSDVYQPKVKKEQ